MVANPYRRAVGHKLEIRYGKHTATARKVRPPKVPMHPIFDTDKNLNLFVTYRDLKLKWLRTTTPSRKRINIARKWKAVKNVNPTNKPTCMFVMHAKMPQKTKASEFPPPGKLDLSESFAIFKSNPLYQHKVTVGDIVQTEKIPRREAGEQITFGTVLMVATKDWTCIGKPTIPYAKVKCTIEQQTLARETLVFKYKKRRRSSLFQRQRQWVTMLRVDEIIVDPDMKPDGPAPKPVRLLDLWANRWLYPEELAGVKYQEDGVTPAAAVHHDGSEHQAGTYHRRGLTECYRYNPDPQQPSYLK